MNRPTLHRFIPIVAVVAVMAVACGESSPEQATASGSSAADVGVSYTAWDGTQATTQTFVGKPLVVNFWASWCTSCLNEIPGFVDVYERHRGEISFLGLNLQDSPDAARELARELGITYELGQDREGTAFQAFGAVAMPTTVLLDAQGQVVKRLDGEVSAEQLEDEVRALLKGAA